MSHANILWVDDEIDMLRPHILFLSAKGYEVQTVNNGSDALDMVDEQDYDLVFLDENMPGLSGIEVLQEMKKKKPMMPVIMITKSEEESIMEDAIGSNIADYLIKPVNPNQILLAIKKNIDSHKIISDKSTMDYQMDFRNISMRLMERLDHKDWKDMYNRLVNWEIKLEKSEDEGVLEIIQHQMDEANRLFSEYVSEHYESWISGSGELVPVMSHTAMKKKVLPELEKGQPLFLFVIDNLRMDQWKAIYPLLNQYFNLKSEEMYYSILPTATQYARNAFFAGLAPSEIAAKYPSFWVEEHEEGSKNRFEEPLLAELLKRLGRDIKFSYNKVLTYSYGRKILENMNNLMHNDLNVIVYNFVDMLSHARTEMEVIRELASDEKAYRSITRSWFLNSPLFSMMKFVAEKGAKMMITTDHGSIKVKRPVKVLGDRNTNTNLRYKFGKSLDYREKDVYAVRKPEKIFLPRPNVSTAYIFCKESDYFVYPNNYNHYATFYKDTFQHGGISLQEMLIPMITMLPK